MNPIMLTILLLFPTLAGAQVVGRADEELAKCAERVVSQIGNRGNRLALIRVADIRTGEEDADCKKIAQFFESGLVKAAQKYGKTVVTRAADDLRATEVEINFSMTDWVSPETRMSAGRKFSADVLVIGKYDPSDHRLEARAIHTETGAILSDEACYAKELHVDPPSVLGLILRGGAIVLLIAILRVIWKHCVAEFTDYPQPDIKPLGWAFLVFSAIGVLAATWFWIGKYIL